jgi:hypothetical protein
MSVKEQPGVTLPLWLQFHERGTVFCLVDHLHHFVIRNDFNSSDLFRHRLWWIRLCFFIGIKVVVRFPSKNIYGNDVTSLVFLILILS